MKSRFANIFNTNKKRSGVVVLLIVALTVGTLGSLIAYNAEGNDNKLLTKLGYTKAFLTEVIANRTTFSQDNEQIDKIVKSMPLQAYRKYSSFSLQTEPSKEINVVYEFDDSYNRGGNGLDPFPGIVEENNALLLFASIEGLDKVNFLHYDQQELNRTDSYTVGDLTFRFGTIAPLNMGFSELYSALGANIQLSEFYFGHYARVYLGIEPERISYRYGEPGEIWQQPDGSTTWVYPNFGEVYSISPDGLEDPEYEAIYYFNSPTAEKNDNLTGLYATRFLHGDHYGKTYEEITGIFGYPSIIKNMDDGNQYIAYALSEGQQRYAYFVLQHEAVVEEGVMYGDDYAALVFKKRLDLFKSPGMMTVPQ